LLGENWGINLVEKFYRIRNAIGVRAAAHNIVLELIEKNGTEDINKQEKFIDWTGFTMLSISDT
jgi:hypothetical protein